MKPADSKKKYYKEIKTVLQGRFWFLVLGLLWLGPLACAQAQYSTTNKKAIKLYIEGVQELRNRQVGRARKLLEDALEKDSAFLEAHRTLAEMGRITADLDLQAKHFAAMARLRPTGPEAPSLLSFAGRQAQSKGRYAQAEELYALALSSTNPLLPELKQKLEKGLAAARFAAETIKTPIKFSRTPLPTRVNRFPMQYTPTATADDQILIYTARKGLSSAFDEDIYQTERGKDGSWSTPEPISDQINTDGNEGTTSVSADGRTLVFTKCEAVSRGGCNIYITRKTGKDWAKPEMIDSVNSAEWDSHPCLSADGNTLLFVSSRPGGLGRYDIYVARRGKNGLFSRAKNAGPAINTDEDEIMPFLHANGQTLFFGSRGHLGMGGLDLFMANRAEGAGTDFTNWQTPKNLGYPLNTAADESSIYIAPDGRRAYYCVEDNQNGFMTRSVLYEFDFGKGLHLERRSFFAKGTVTDAKTGNPLGSRVELVNNASRETIYAVESDPETGKYLMALPEGSQYGLTVSATGYLFQSRFIDFKQAADSGAVLLDFKLEALKKGAKTVLNNVFFASGSADLLPESDAELAQVAGLLKQNPKLKVEIGGHTDSVGTAEANLMLSKKRAQTVKDALLKTAIPDMRLQATGYGETNPAQPNRTLQGRAMNRRIEFTVLEN